MDSLSLPSKFLLLFLLLFMSSSQAAAAAAAAAAEEALRSLPAAEVLQQSRLVSESYRRKLGSFQICALCTCCGGPRGLCLPSPCCYAINCNIPNRPFGFCSFTPRTCNCLGCHL